MKIRNKKTGEIREVSMNELNQYGLGGQHNKLVKYQNKGEVKKDKIKQAFVTAYNNYHNRVFLPETLKDRQNAYDRIRPSDYLDFNNYARWITNNQREEFDDPRSEEGFRIYLGLEDNPKYFSKSSYSPSINKNPNVKNYYKVDPQLEEEIFNTFKDKVKLNEVLKTNEAEVISKLDDSHKGYFKENGKEFIAPVSADKNILFGRPMVSNARVLGNFNVSHGKDKQGEYISYSDQYDFPDLFQKRMKGVPYSIYNRIYYPKKQTGGEMIKRADGSYSRRGLWDNIRANAGSGKRPTKKMLNQERKIRNQHQAEYGMEVMGNGGVPTNPGFVALPEYVQQNIINNMATGGQKMPPQLAYARFAAAGNLNQLGRYGYQDGGDIPTIEGPSGYMNEDNVWVVDNETITKQAQELGAKKVLTEGGSLIIFDDNWNIVAADDNPDAPYKQGGSVTLNAGGENHKIYVKTTNRGEGKKGHIMVNHPTMDKGMWDTIDLTKKSGAKTIAQGVAATKKWHMENPYMKEYGGNVPMFGPGGQKQNPPKVYTDKKKFKQAQKMYTDSLNLYNNNLNYKNKYLDFVNKAGFDKTKLYESNNGEYIDVKQNPKIGAINYGHLRSTGSASERNNKGSYNESDYFRLKNGDNLKVSRNSPEWYILNKGYYNYKKPVQPVVYQPQQTINTTQGQITGTVRPNQIKGSELMMMINPVKSKENLERLKMIAPSLDNTDIQIQGQLLPIPQMRLPQQGSRPFYGPGNTIVGYTDDNMQFYPAQQYTGAPNNQLNLQDKELLNNPEMLQKFVQSKDNYKFAEGGGIPERYRNMGFTNVGAKRQSTRPGKKWMVLAKKGDQYKVVHGGYKGMQDFKQHHSEQRKENFWSRMGGRNSSKATDPFSPLYWHKRFGTWEYGGQPMAVGGQNVMNPIVKKDNRNWLEYLKN